MFVKLTWRTSWLWRMTKNNKAKMLPILCLVADNSEQKKTKPYVISYKLPAFKTNSQVSVRKNVPVCVDSLPRNSSKTRCRTRVLWRVTTSSCVFYTKHVQQRTCFNYDKAYMVILTKLLYKPFLVHRWNPDSVHKLVPAVICKRIVVDSLFWRYENNQPRLLPKLFTS